MAPGDVWHGPRCSLAGLGPVALGYRPCCWPGGSAGSPQCILSWGVGSFLSLAPYVCTCVSVSSATWLLFTGVPAWCVVFCFCGVLGHLAPVHRCARSVRCFACAVSWATWLLSTGVPAQCVALRVQCLGLIGSCSPVCPSGMLFCVCGVLGHVAPVHRCARSVCCVACAVSWANWLLFMVCPRGLLCCVCGVLRHLAPVHRGARSMCCFACAVSWATWLLFTSVSAWFVLLCVRSSGPLGSCSPVCPLCLLLCVRAVPGHLAPVHRCARSVCYVACAVSLANWLLLTGVPARCAVLGVRCPGPLGSCSPLPPLSLSCCVYGVLGPLVPVQGCARSVCCVACAVSWATWFLFTGVPARCVVLRVRCPGPFGSCSPVRLLSVLCCVYGVLGPLTPVHRCARAVCCVACAVSWATWLMFTGALARSFVLRVCCPGPLGSCSPVCPLVVLCCVCGVLRHLAPVHRCARSVSCVACTVSWATWLLFTGVPAQCVVLREQCPGPLGPCSPVRLLGLSCCVYVVLGPLAPVPRCARSVCSVVRMRCPGHLGSCTPVCPLGVFCSVCGVLAHLAPVHRCARSVLLFCVYGVLGPLATVHWCAR